MRGFPFLTYIRMFVGCKVHLEQIGVEIFDNLINVEGKDGSLCLLSHYRGCSLVQAPILLSHGDESLIRPGCRWYLITAYTSSTRTVATSSTFESQYV